MTRLLFVSRTPPIKNRDATAETNIRLIEHLRSIGMEVRYLFLEGSFQFFDSPITDNERRRVAEVAETFLPEVVIADYAWLSDAFQDCPTAIERIIFAHDLRCTVIADFEANGYQETGHGWTAEQEGLCLATATTIMTLNRQDTELCRKLSPKNNVIQIGIAADLKFDEGQEVAGRCLFVATNYGHNVVALEKFLRESWPRVIAECPDARLHVCGNIGGSFIPEFFSNVVWRGFVENLDQEYAECQVVLIPLFHRGGMKVKCVEAIAHGKPIVSSRPGIDGFPEAEDACVKVAESSQEFADHIIEVLENSGLRGVMKYYSAALARLRLGPEKAYEPLVKLLNELRSTKNLQ